MTIILNNLSVMTLRLLFIFVLYDIVLVVSSVIYLKIFINDIVKIGNSLVSWCGKRPYFMALFSIEI
jgi:hypothetical protein